MLITLLAAFLLLAMPAPAPAQEWTCGAGAHTVSGASAAGMRAVAADAQRPFALLPAPAWVDRNLWDALVFDAHYHDFHEDAPLGDRSSRVIRKSDVERIDICLPSADRNYTGERLAPYANRRWWKEHIDGWTGLNWRGSVTSTAHGCLRTYGAVINVHEGDADSMDKVAAEASVGTGSPDGRMVSTATITFNPDWLRDDASDAQIARVLAHELGHVLGLHHVPDDRLVMYPRIMDIVGTYTATERRHARLAYEVGPGAPYPGFTGDDPEPVPALPLAGLLLLVVLLLGAVLVARGIHGCRPRAMST